MPGLWSYAYDYDDPYVVGLTSFFCFAIFFCPCVYAYAYANVWTRLKDDWPVTIVACGSSPRSVLLSLKRTIPAYDSSVNVAKNPENSPNGIIYSSTKNRT